jgi:AraC-like DNA-binding protein
MHGAQRPAYDHAVFRVREALRAFVDACHVLVRQPDGRSDDDTAARIRVTLARVLCAWAASSHYPAANFRVTRVVQYLEDRFADPTLHLASAAQHVDVTPAHLDRLLKEHTRLTFLQQLRRIRVRHAERLLLTTVSSIKETAYACGYSSIGRFGRDFRRVHGCCPREWRNLRSTVAAQIGPLWPRNSTDSATAYVVSRFRARA